MKAYTLKKVSFALLAGAMFFILSESIFGQNMFRKINDFDGDGKADFAVTRDIGGYRYWYVWQSTQGLKVFQWGTDADKNVAGDFDGDGKTDFAIMRKSPTPGIPSYTTYAFWVKGSQNTPYAVEHYATLNELPVAEFIQDYDGDGKADITVFTTTPPFGRRLYILESSGGRRLHYLLPDGYTPIRTGDMTGDGKSDFVSYNSSFTPPVVRIANYTASESDIRNVPFGMAGDEFVTADFDGDGIGDLAVFRQSEGVWWWIRSSDSAMHAAQFGQTGDKPVPADYDGDGKTDLAIWRPGETQSHYWVYGSLGNVFVVPFGIGTDKLVTY